MNAPLAILPGLLCDSRMFEEMRASIADSVVVDGFYAGCTTIGGMADYALERLPDRFVLMGHSMGARVALEVYRKAPERVQRLVLADTGVHPVGTGEAEKRFALLTLGKERGMEALVDSWLPPMVWEPKHEDRALMEGLRAMCVDAGVDTYRNQINALLARPETEDVLASIACDTLVLVGEHDQWSPPVQHEAIAASIANSQMVVVPDAGHMAPAENPAGFAAPLVDWLAS